MATDFSEIKRLFCESDREHIDLDWGSDLLPVLNSPEGYELIRAGGDSMEALIADLDSHRDALRQASRVIVRLIFPTDAVVTMTTIDLLRHYIIGLDLKTDITFSLARITDLPHAVEVRVLLSGQPS